MNVSAALDSAAEVLRSSEVAEYRREAASLLAFALGKDDVFLVAHPEYQLSPEQLELYQKFVKRRSDREPFQYIVGSQEFYALAFRVSPDVLIPRTETEILVEAAIDELIKKDGSRFCEIGVGSGCISIAIVYNVANARGVGVDISPRALEVARSNAETHGVTERLDLRLGNVFEGITGEFDLIVSNPPYVPDDQLEVLQAEVRQFEPHTALAGGASGLEVIERIIAEAQHFLVPGGVLLMEIGFDQSERVSRLFDTGIWSELKFHPDLQGIPRIVFARCR